MKFIVLDAYSTPTGGHPFDTAILVRDNWDDYSFKTSFILYVSEAGKEPVEIGPVKIGYEGMLAKSRVELPAEFQTLEKKYFSLGQDDTYYENLNTRFHKLRELILESLNDLAKDLGRFEKVRNDDVVSTSLMRDRSPSYARVTDQFNRIANGGPRFQGFSFEFRFASDKENDSGIKFKVVPGSRPPTNVHGIIGPNGVGKSHLLRSIEKAFYKTSEGESTSDKFSFTNLDGTFARFDNLVIVSFSAFDPFTQSTSQLANSSYIGLKRRPGGLSDSEFKSTNDIQTEFSVALRHSFYKKREWLVRVFDLLDRDPIVSSGSPYKLTRELLSIPKSQSIDNSEAFSKIAKEFSLLSSGHQVVLHTLVQLVRYVDERSLVLIDEPETHLHPPLLSTFVRAISELLADRNGIAVVATHSPVVLQEIPSTCVWILSRWGEVPRFSRPTIETFGENVSTLTRQVFDLEVNKTGFYQMLSEAASKFNTFEEVLHFFNGQLGDEAKAFVHILLSRKEVSR